MDLAKKDGSSFEAEVTSQQLGDGLIMAIVRDLKGPRKAFERKIRASEERLASILQTAPDVVMTVDRAGTILFINRKFPRCGPSRSSEPAASTTCRPSRGLAWRRRSTRCSRCESSTSTKCWGPPV